MSVKQRFNWLDNQRVDKPHLKSLDDSVIFDFKTILQAFQSDTPYILRGFNIQNPGAAINAPASNLQVVVDSGIIWAPNQTDGPYLRVPPGTPNETLNTANPKVVGSFTANATNYVALRLKRSPDAGTTDLMAFWDVDAAVNFTKSVPTGLVLNYEFVINTSGFGSNIPLALVVTDGANNVTSITNAKQGLFRLGTGGANPNPNYQWSYTPAIENPLTLATSGGPSPFVGGDWEIKTFKEWMDAVMTEIKLMKGSSLWYVNGSTSISNVNLADLWFDAVGHIIAGVGRFIHSDTTPGEITWSSDIYIRSLIGPLTYTIPAGTITLNNGDVAYIILDRDTDFQASNTFTFTNGSPTVTATAPILGISAGDWIKFHSHDIGKYARVSAVSGTTITLAAPYAGATAIGKALKATGSYTITVSPAANVPANADVFWIARRDDNAVTAATIETPANSGATRNNDIATITTTAPHNFVVGQIVSISGVVPSSFDNVAEILSVPSANTFTYLNPGPNVGPGSAGNGTVAPRAKVYLRALGELDQGEERQIDDNITQNILKFIGSESEVDTTPPYTILPNSLANYTFSTNSNLTQAISAITGNVNDILTTLDQPSYDESVLITSSTTPHVQASQTVGGGPGAIIDAAAERVGQSFTAILSNYLNNVVVRMRAVGSPDADIVCEIREDNSGEPGLLLQTSSNTIAANTLTTSYANYTFNFEPTFLENTFVYWIVIRVANVVTLNASDYIDIENNNTNPYAGGTEAFYNGTTWSNITGSDLVFTANALTVGPNQMPVLGAGAIVKIPNNSRLSGNPQQFYVLGKGTLELYLNGQYLNLNTDWEEVGTTGNSKLIKLQQSLVNGDRLTFRLDATGGPGSGGSSTFDIMSYPTETAADNADYILIYDVSAGAHRKQTRGNFLAGLTAQRNVNTYNNSVTITNSQQHVRVDASSGAVTITLPSALGNVGHWYTIKKIDGSANAVTIAAQPGETIDGNPSITITVPNASYTIIAGSPTEWDIV